MASLALCYHTMVLGDEDDGEKEEETFRYNLLEVKTCQVEASCVIMCQN